jgi:hypothetical protein
MHSGKRFLLDEHTYYGSPFMPHAKLPIGEKHFDRWLELFDQTVDEHFSGDKAYEAKWRADRLALMFKDENHLVARWTTTGFIVFLFHKKPNSGADHHSGRVNGFCISFVGNSPPYAANFDKVISDRGKEKFKAKQAIPVEYGFF